MTAKVITYDNRFDAVATVTVPLRGAGARTVSYSYDVAARRTQMQVTGQTAVTHGYDDADRPTSVTQGASEVSFDHDVCTPTTSPIIIQPSISTPTALVSRMICESLHSIAAMAPPTRGGFTFTDATGVSPARANSSTPGATEAEVAFMAVAWTAPTKLSPGEFMPLAEQSALILPIGRWVMRTAAEQVQQFHARGLGGVSVAVNVSARQFADPDFLADVRMILDETGVDPGALELEISEGVAMLDTARSTYPASLGDPRSLDEGRP